MKTLTTLPELEAAKGLDKAVINFSAPAWCRPCQAFEPAYKATEELTEVPLFFVDVDEASDLAALEGIASVPSVLYYSNGEFQARLQPSTAVKFAEALNNL
jgi:thioredoxin 1